MPSQTTHAGAPTLMRLIDPRSVVVLGASDDPARLGGIPLAQMREHGFDGPVFGVNPKYVSVQGYTCYPDVGSLPEVPDVAVLAVGADRVADQLRACARAGIKAAVVFSAGYAELGDAAGVARQDELAALAAELGMLVAGPNCSGIANLRTGAMLSFSRFERSGGDGETALVSQSGAMAHAIWRAGHRIGVDFGPVITTGNEASLGLVDYLEHLAEDPHCRTVLAYVEQIRGGDRFRRAAAAMRRAGKMLCVLKVGRSEKGIEAASAHTAALAGDAVAYRAAFREAGVVEAGSIAELVDVAYLGRFGARPAGTRIGVLSVSGAAGVMLADSFADRDLPLPTFGPALQDALRVFVPPYGLVANPVDMTANAVTDAAVLPKLLSILDGAAEVDTVLIYASGGMVVRGQAGGQGRGPAKLVVDIDLVGSGNRKAVEGLGIAYFDDLDRAARALSLYLPFRTLQEPVPDSAHDPVAASPGLVQARAELLAARQAGRRSLSEPEGKALLARAGVEIVGDRLARSEAEAAATADAIGYPVVLKVVSPDIQHKTEVGGIRLGVATAAAARAAYVDILDAVATSAPGARIDGVSVQRQVTGAVELLVGATRDPIFGWLLTVGLGGIWTELMRDVAHALAPVGEREAEQMIRSLRGFPLLDGFRGAPSADVAAAARCIAALSACLDVTGDHLVAVEINPLLVRTIGEGAVAADALVLLAE